eukprot:sb/3465647/
MVLKTTNFFHVANGTAIQCGTPAKYSPILDLCTGLLLGLGMLLGTPSNLSALRYFLSSRYRTIPQKLYTLLTSINVVTCFAHIPVTYSLLSTTRSPGLFSEATLCAAWAILNELLQRAGVFVVMILTVTRTVAIVRPLFPLGTRVVVKVCIGFALLNVITVVINSCFSVRYVFVVDFCYCVRTVDGSASLAQSWWTLVDNIITSLSLILPIVTIFISLLVSLLELERARKRAVPSPVDGVKSSNAPFHRSASVTILLISCLFFICYLPLSILRMVAIAMITNPYPGTPFLSRTFINWHSWTLCKVLFITLNAALNPLLYFTRMSGYASWVRKSKFILSTKGSRKKRPKRSGTDQVFMFREPIYRTSSNKIDISNWKPEPVS